jgi:SMC interacting uncharacterized protein involved in chromosome segregation
MDLGEIAERLGKVEAYCETNAEQIRLLQENNEALHKIATSVELLTTKQCSMDKKLDKVSDKVEELEKIPAKRWHAVVEKVLCVAAGAVAAYILAQLGLG